ncbi:MAG: ROK family protein [Candidatus Nomurabacteria bacterium]|nr:MAG: ROK family protein [Candidatus Nomurabacteria bacterium]
MSYLVLDIGGSKTQIAVSENLSDLRDIKSFKTPKNFKKGIQDIIENINSLKPKGKIKGVAIGVRGLLNEDRSGIENDTILTDWAKKPLTETLEKELKTPVFLENDTALAGLGEAANGAGKGLDIVVYHSISTGIGGVRIEDGEIDTSTFGFDPGQQILDIDRTILGEDITPTLDNLVSGLGVETRLGTKPYDIPQTDMIWNELAEYLAHGLRNTILYWSPDVIILGGAMILGEPKIQLDAIRKYTVDVLEGFVPSPFITTSSLGDQAGLHGGMVLLKKSGI